MKEEQMYLFCCSEGTLTACTADLFRASENSCGAGWATVTWGHGCWWKTRPLQRLQKFSIQHRKPRVAAEGNSYAIDLVSHKKKNQNWNHHQSHINPSEPQVTWTIAWLWHPGRLSVMLESKGNSHKTLQQWDVLKQSKQFRPRLSFEGCTVFMQTLNIQNRATSQWLLPVAQRMLFSLWQRRQLWWVYINRVLAAVGLVQFDQSGVLWPLTVHLLRDIHIRQLSFPFALLWT